MAYLHVVRHAQPDFAGNYDSITGLGERQSAWLGRHYAERGLSFARIVSGRLQRHAQTVAGIAAELPAAATVEVDARLNEYDLTSLLEHFGADEALRAGGDRQRYFSAVREVLRSWSAHEGRLPGAETWQEFGQRADDAIASAADGLPADAQVLVVTSGGVIGRIVADLLGADAEAAIQLNLQTRNTGITEIVVGRSARRLVAFNAVPHLHSAERQHAVTHV